jgi:hypothetical protein
VLVYPFFQVIVLRLVGGNFLICPVAGIIDPVLAPRSVPAFTDPLLAGLADIPETAIVLSR